MNKTVWKFGLETVDRQVITVPIDHTFLSVQVQKQGDAEIPCMWLLVNPDSTRVRMTVDTYGTGNPVDDDPGDFLGTYQLHDGALVFHVFCSKTEEIEAA